MAELERREREIIFEYEAAKNRDEFDEADVKFCDYIGDTRDLNELMYMARKVVSKGGVWADHLTEHIVENYMETVFDNNHPIGAAYCENKERISKQENLENEMERLNSSQKEALRPAVDLSHVSMEDMERELERRGSNRVKTIFDDPPW